MENKIINVGKLYFFYVLNVIVSVIITKN